MAIVHADNFSIYGTNVSLLGNGVYTVDSSASVHLQSDPDGISSGHVLQVTYSSDAGIRYALPSTTTTLGAAARVWFPALPGADSESVAIFDFRTSGNGTKVFLTLNPAGQLRIAGMTSGEITTDVPAITAQGWYHIEMKVVEADAASTVEVRVEGITVIDETGLTLGSNTTPFGILKIGMRNNNPSGAVEWYTKDYVIWNASGSYNTDFLGSVLVHSLLPDSDVSLNWTPSTGTTGWDILDNIPPNDSEYISAPYSATAPNYPDPYVATLTDLPVETTSVKAVISFVRAAKSDGGDGSLQVGVISDPSGTPATALGADRPITVAQTYWRDVFEVDPATSAAWLPQAVNDAEIQINRTS